MNIIDCHQHLFSEGVDTLLHQMDSLGIERVRLSPDFTDETWGDTGNDMVERAFRSHPDRILGMAFIRLGDASPSKVREYKEKGFFGLKAIHPLLPYDHPSNDPIYEEAERLRMPILFHTSESVYVSPKLTPWGKDLLPRRMLPIYLDRIAIYFPDLILVAAHMGNTYIQQACALAASRPNVYLDISGAGDLKRMPRSFFEHIIYWGRASHKLLYGSDGSYSAMPRVLEEARAFLEKVGMSEELKERTFRRNAEELMGRCGWS